MEANKNKNKRTISVARGLSELKLYDRKISKAINEGLFITAYKGKSDTTIHNISRSEAEKRIKSSVNSTEDLIENRSNLKRAIVTSNANTSVIIGDVNYTVAEAIEKKDSVEYEQDFIRGLNHSFAVVLEKVDISNQQMENSLKDLLRDLAGSENNELTIKTTSEAYKEVNEMKLLDPVGIEKLIDKLQKQVDNFLLDVDVVLSESNAITLIEV